MTILREVLNLKHGIRIGPKRFTAMYHLAQQYLNISKQSEQGYLYVCQSILNKSVFRIGYSTDPSVRVKKLKSFTPVSFTPTLNMRLAKNLIHRYFGVYAIDNNCFNIDDMPRLDIIKHCTYFSEMADRVTLLGDMQTFNINTCTITQLLTIGGIGEKTVTKVIAQRPIATIGHLVGIGPAKMAQLKRYTYVTRIKEKGILPKISPGKINLNTATKSQLESIPEIGPITAEKILTQRKRQNIKSISELAKIKGVGSVKIKSLIQTCCV